MCTESKRLTPFNPTPLTDEQKARLQNIAPHCITNHDANARGLARYEALKRTGIWEHQNFIENFGEEECES